MVEASAAEEEKKGHPQKSGIDTVNSEAALAVIDKVIDKMVRVTVTDGRIFLGKLMAVD